MSEASPLQGRLVFVVGAPRSGTTWLQRMLSVHPDVVSIPSETHLFSAGLSVLRDGTQGSLPDSTATATWFMPPEEFAAAARAFADACFLSYVRRRQPTALRVVERSPTHVWHLGLIAAIYPDAYVLHIVRDGRDVVRSQVAQTWGASELVHAAQQWGSSVRAARAAAPLVPRYREVRYEELLVEPGRIKEVFEFLDLDVSPETLDYALLEGGLEVNVDPTRPDVAAQKWRLEWTDADIDAFESVAGDALDLLGYPRLPSLVAPAAPASRGRRRLPVPPRPSRPRPTTFRPEGERMQRQVAALLGSLDGTSPDQLDGLLADPQVEIRVGGAHEEWRGLGPTAVHHLKEVLLAEGPWGDPLRGEQTIDAGTWTVLASHRAADGTVVDRVLVITLDRSAAVKALRYFRLPLVPAG